MHIGKFWLLRLVYFKDRKPKDREEIIVAYWHCGQIASCACYYNNSEQKAEHDMGAIELKDLIAWMPWPRLEDVINGNLLQSEPV